MRGRAGAVQQGILTRTPSLLISARVVLAPHSRRLGVRILLRPLPEQDKLDERGHRCCGIVEDCRQRGQEEAADSEHLWW